MHFLCVTPFCIPKETMSNTVPICIQQDATLHSLLYLETALHVSGGTSTHHQEWMQLYLQHVVFVTLLTVWQICMHSRWWVEVPRETCRAVSRCNELCNAASCWMYIGIFVRCTNPWTLNLSNAFVNHIEQNLLLTGINCSAFNWNMWTLTHNKLELWPEMTNNITQIK